MSESNSEDSGTAEDDICAFDPVPCRRHDGWTAERQRGFIAGLRRISHVAAAANAVGMSPKSAYALRKRAGEGSGFARAWDAALVEGGHNALGHVIDRAVNGEARPYFYRGIQRGVRRVYNDRLLIAALRGLDALSAAGLPGSCPSCGAALKRSRR